MIPDGSVQRVQRWANARVPDHARNQIRIDLDVTDRTITIVECRPPWHPDMDDEWSRFPIARLRYTKVRDEWSLYWRDRPVFPSHKLVAEHWITSLPPSPSAG